MCDPFPSELFRLRKKLAVNHIKQGKLVKLFQEAYPAVLRHGRNVRKLEIVKAGLSSDFLESVHKSETSQLAVAMDAMNAIKLSMEAGMKEREQLVIRETSMVKQVLDTVCIETGGSVPAEEDVKANEADESAAEEDQSGVGEQVSIDRKRRLEEDGEECPEDEKDW